jgi:O-antigen/teichoic acid export membrane protein
MQNSANNKKSLDNLTIGARGGLIAFILRVTSSVLALVNQIVLARILGADGMGQVLLAVSVIYIFSLIGKFGMEDAMMRFIPLYREKRDYPKLKGAILFALRFALVNSLIFTAIVMVFSDPFAVRIFHSEGLKKLLPIAAIILPATVSKGVMGGILKGYNDTFKALFPEFFISPFFRIVIFLLLSIKGGEPLFAIYAFALGELLAVFLSCIFLRKRVKEISTDGYKYEYRKILDVAFTMIFTTFSLILFTQTDLWIVGIYTSTEDVGIYGVATKLANLIILPLGIFSAVIPPLMASLHTSNNKPELNKLVRESSRWILTTTMPVILILILEGDLLLRTLFGEMFTSGYTALVILSMGQIINSSTGLVGYLLQMTGWHRTIMKINIVWALINVVLNIILVPILGINGAAMSTAFCLAMGNITASVAVYKRLGIVTLARGAGFDIIVLTIAFGIYIGIVYSNFIFFKHIILIILLLSYMLKSMITHDIPWRTLLSLRR